MLLRRQTIIISLVLMLVLSCQSKETLQLKAVNNFDEKQGQFSYQISLPVLEGSSDAVAFSNNIQKTTYAELTVLGQLTRQNPDHPYFYKSSFLFITDDKSRIYSLIFNKEIKRDFSHEEKLTETVMFNKKGDKIGLIDLLTPEGLNFIQQSLQKEGHVLAIQELPLLPSYVEKNQLILLLQAEEKQEDRLKIEFSLQQLKEKKLLQKGYL